MAERSDNHDAMVTTDLYFLRHGEPERNCNHILSGLYDRHAQLSMEGMERAVQWRHQFHGMFPDLEISPFAMAATSQLIRTRQTLLPLFAGCLASEYIVAGCLDDWAYGAKGLRAREYERQYTDDATFWAKRPLQLIAPINSRQLPQFGSAPGASAEAKLYDESNRQGLYEQYRLQQSGLIMDWIDTYAGTRILLIGHAATMVTIYDLMHPSTCATPDEALDELPIEYGEGYIFHITSYTEKPGIVGVKADPLKLDPDLPPPTIEEMQEIFTHPNPLMDAQLDSAGECRIEQYDAPWQRYYRLPH